MKYVVNVKLDTFDVYIGRANNSPYGNPFKIGHDGDRSQVIEKFKDYIYNDEALLARVRKELRGKILGCHCKPFACHGDVLAEIANEQS